MSNHKRKTWRTSKAIQYTDWLLQNIEDEYERSYEIRNFDNWLKSCVSGTKESLQSLIDAIEGRLRGAALGDAKYIEARIFYQKVAKESLERLNRKTSKSTAK